MSHKILLVDDEPNILLSVDFLMRKNGYRVLLARNGSEAMQQLQDQVPNLIILDIMMPDVDGYQICEYVKSNKQYQNTKVIFLSAKSKETDISKGLNLGADAYITKPFANKVLIDRVKDLLS